MGTKIQDGVGTNKQAKVDLTNRLWTRSTTQTMQNEASLEGDSHFVGSGAVVLTSANNSAVFFIQNNEDRDLMIISLTFQTKPPTGATSIIYDAFIHVNPTGLSTSTAGAQVNPNVGSSNTLDATITKGDEAATVTNGTVGANFFLRHSQIEEINSSIVIPKGGSMAVSITPPPGNTNMICSFSARTFLVKET